ncbi:hypothetical protein A0J61_10258 [Choanephora cucurbitarum]|uniref:Uncharacterized protein n=1 Tax=Choanephora cucurbitarum TaxID=101091 RepID=A0A1C7N2X9_9FUNG|nr:hypothetical protein A0J61_10258 [Choanephora cucurbitarum]
MTRPIQKSSLKITIVFLALYVILKPSAAAPVDLSKRTSELFSSATAPGQLALASVGGAFSGATNGSDKNEQKKKKDKGKKGGRKAQKPSAEEPADDDDAPDPEDDESPNQGGSSSMSTQEQQSYDNSREVVGNIRSAFGGFLM